MIWGTTTWKILSLWIWLWASRPRPLSLQVKCWRYSRLRISSYSWRRISHLRFRRWDCSSSRCNAIYRGICREEFSITFYNGYKIQKCQTYYQRRYDIIIFISFVIYVLTYREKKYRKRNCSTYWHRQGNFIVIFGKFCDDVVPCISRKCKTYGYWRAS